jgi:hypothetical protein
VIAFLVHVYLETDLGGLSWLLVGPEMQMHIATQCVLRHLVHSEIPSHRQATEK